MAEYPRQVLLTLVHLAVLVLVTAFAYQAVRNHHFVWDTIPFVLENPWVHEWTLENVKSMFTSAHRANWHPVVLLSHALDISLFGYDSGSHHLVNLGMHIINALLVYGLIRRLLGLAGQEPIPASWTAFLTAMIFAIHPQHVESVAWVVERKDVLYSIFALGCLMVYLGHARHADHQGGGLICLLLFCLAVGAKPMAVTIPFVLLMFDLYPLRRIDLTPGDITRSLAAKWPYLLITAAVIVVTLNTQAKTMPNLQDLPVWARVANAVDNTWFYTLHYLWPVNLSPFYPYPLNAAYLASPQFWLPGAVFLTVTLCATALVWRQGLRWPLLLAGFYLLTLLPVSGLIQVGPAKATDHYVYLATIPFSLLTALGISWCWTRFRRTRVVLLPVASAYLVFLLAVTLVQVNVWSNPLSLWNFVTHRYPDHPFGHRNLSAVYLTMNEWDKALYHGEKSLQLGSPDTQWVIDLRQDYESRQADLKDQNDGK